MKYIWAKLLILIGSLIFLSALGYGFWSRQQKMNLGEALPEQLAGMSLVYRVDGQDALDEITRMHDLQFNLVSGAIGIYGNPTEIIIWITAASSDANAQSMVDAMETRIAELGSQFRPAGTVQIDGRKIYVSEGIGQIHYYFRSGSRVVWISCEQSLGEKALQEALRFYP